MSEYYPVEPDLQSVLESEARLIARVAELEAERDRLREALGNMVSLASPYFTDGPQRVAISAAAAALEGE